ncbi:hypothetical protein M2140_001556 [Clostridiales Family XIII bacterium PM5-7]
MMNPINRMENKPKKSVVQVYFTSRHTSYAYYNDQFDLQVGDLVYVEGKLEGKQGRVVEVNYNFKIKISDYKRVIALVDTTITGELFMAGSHFVTYDEDTLPVRKIRNWFMAPQGEEDDFVSGSDEESFPLDQLEEMSISAATAERGKDYYLENMVKFLSLDGTKGYAIVEGNEYYEVEFQYRDGKISQLTCNCFCSHACKHQFAVMLQLRAILEFIEKHDQKAYQETGYFSAMDKTTLFEYAIMAKKTGSIAL